MKVSQPVSKAPPTKPSLAEFQEGKRLGESLLQVENEYGEDPVTFKRLYK